MADAAIVQRDSGPVRGTVTEECRLFQGIPYAASTAGDHRWRAPALVGAWTEPRDATNPATSARSNRRCMPTSPVSMRTACSST